ncbi:MAG: hypothetical protein JWM85_2078 [Acidimicrobiaceae bacterium]|nr:hypothetical protein [Acidimicrobiaceae bacterium]
MPGAVALAGTSRSGSPRRGRRRGGASSASERWSASSPGADGALDSGPETVGPSAWVAVPIGRSPRRGAADTGASGSDGGPAGELPCTEGADPEGTVGATGGREAGPGPAGEETIPWLRCTAAGSGPAGESERKTSAGDGALTLLGAVPPKDAGARVTAGRRRAGTAPDGER